MRGAGRIGIGQPLRSAREDGVSHEHTRDANREGAEGKEGKEGPRRGLAEDSSKDNVAGSERRK